MFCFPQLDRLKKKGQDKSKARLYLLKNKKRNSDLWPLLLQNPTLLTLAQDQDDEN